MTKIEIINNPENKADKTQDEKIRAIVEDRNKVIAKRFNLPEKDLKIELHFSKQKLLSEIRNTGDSLGVYCGYLDWTDKIHLIHPSTVTTIFKDNLNKEISIMIDYCLIKFYMCKKYWPEQKGFKLYYKHVSEQLAKISSGNYRENIIKFDMKIFVERKRYTPDKEIAIIFYIMLQKSGLDYIYEHLDKIIEDCDIKKTTFNIYKKSLWDLIAPYQKEIKEEERKLQNAFKIRRR